MKINFFSHCREMRKFQTCSAVGALPTELFTSRRHDFLTFHVLHMLQVLVGGAETVYKRKMKF